MKFVTWWPEPVIDSLPTVREGGPLNPPALGPRAPVLHTSARRAGAARWLHARLFEILGGWVTTVAEPEAKIALATQSSHHGWHAGLWGERLPTLHGVDPATWVRPASAGVEEAVAALAAAPTTVERLAALHRCLLPRLAAAHADHLERASAVADAPTIRTLGLVLADLNHDQRAGERLLQRLLTDPADVRRAAGRQAELECILVAAGPLLT